MEAVGADLRGRHAITTEILDLVDAGPGLAAFSRDGLSSSARGVIEAIESADGLVNRPVRAISATVSNNDSQAEGSRVGGSNQV